LPTTTQPVCGPLADHQSPRQIPCDAFFERWLTVPNQLLIKLRVYVLTIPPPAGIERPEAARVNVKLRIMLAKGQNFLLSVLKKTFSWHFLVGAAA
jgi:hypothetical protein